MIAATFHGPNHFKPNHDESTIEVFDNIGHAISALFDRYDQGKTYPQRVHYLNGDRANLIFPFIELGDYFECYKVERAGNDAIDEALTAVHLGTWDYKLLLMRPFGAGGTADDDTVAVSVQKH